MTRKQTNGKENEALVLDNSKLPKEIEAISIMAPCIGGKKEPPPIAMINPDEPILAPSPRPLSAKP